MSNTELVLPWQLEFIDCFEERFGTHFCNSVDAMRDSDRVVVFVLLGLPIEISATNGARSVMQRICERYDLAIDGEYLKPHGARRGLGHELYSKGRAEDAQSALRHKSIETTHSAYSDIQAGETAGRIDDVVGE